MVLETSTVWNVEEKFDPGNTAAESKCYDLPDVWRFDEKDHRCEFNLNQPPPIRQHCSTISADTSNSRLTLKSSRRLRTPPDVTFDRRARSHVKIWSGSDGKVEKFSTSKYQGLWLLRRFPVPYRTRYCQKYFITTFVVFNIWIVQFLSWLY